MTALVFARRSDLASRPFVPLLDVLESEEAIVLQAELPGVAREDLEVGLEQGALILRGEKGRHEGQGVGYRHVERRRGRFERRLRLPSGVDEETIRASFHNGVLTLTLPKRSAVRTVPVTTS